MAVVSETKTQILQTPGLQRQFRLRDEVVLSTFYKTILFEETRMLIVLGSKDWKLRYHMEIRARDKYICYRLIKQSSRITPIPWTQTHKEVHKASQGKTKKSYQMN
jgi:DNA-directed RNA polymerase delta subunit